MSLRTLIRDVVILAALSITVVLGISYGCGVADAAPVPGENGEELIDLLWWLRRGGIPSFHEAASELWGTWEGVSGYFHHGPSR